MNSRAGLVALLVILGAGWGLTQPLTKIAVSEGYRHFGLIFWQFVIGAVLLTVFSVFRGKSLPLGGKQIRFYILIALIGTLFPNSASFEAARHLPAGILSILLSFMAIIAFPIALTLRIDRFSWPRLVGLLFGIAGVSLMIWPEASLPDRAKIVFIPLGLVAPLFYAIEGNVVAKWGTAGCDPVAVLLGASIVGAMMTLPLALWSGQWITPGAGWGAPDWALVISSIIHTLAYTAYVWLVGRAGAVFAAQVSYIVTGFGLFWAMLILSESYSNWIWVALALIFTGLFLVQPRENTSVLGTDPMLENDRT